MKKWYSHSRWLLVAAVVVQMTGCAQTSRTLARWTGRDQDTAIAKSEEKPTKATSEAELKKGTKESPDLTLAAAEKGNSAPNKQDKASPKTSDSLANAKADEASSKLTNKSKAQESTLAKKSGRMEDPFLAESTDFDARPSDTLKSSVAKPSAGEKTTLAAADQGVARTNGSKTTTPSQTSRSDNPSAGLPNWAGGQDLAATTSVRNPLKESAPIQEVAHKSVEGVKDLPAWAVGTDSPKATLTASLTEPAESPIASSSDLASPTKLPERRVPIPAGALTSLCPDAEGTVRELVASLETEDDEVLKRNIHNLGRLGPDARAALPALVKLQKHPHGAVAVHAALATIRVEGVKPHSLNCLTAAMKSPDPSVRSFSAAVIAGLGPEGQEALPAVAAALNDSDGYVRLHVSEVLIRFDAWQSQALTTLLGCLKDQDENVRWLTTYSLAELAPKSPEVVDALVRTLDDPSDKVCVGAAYALGELGELASPAKDRLRVLTFHANDEVRATAQHALSRIEG